MLTPRRARHGAGAGPRARRGMALIAVLWIVAALSIMIMGLTQTVKQSIRAAIMQRDLTSGQALGEAAIALALQQLAVQTTPLTGTGQISVNFAGVDMTVTAAPLNGWIALNGASAPMLAALLQTAGGLNAANAQQMAQAIVDWRDGVPQLDPGAPAPSGDQRRRFDAVQDLMLVPGMTYDLYARIAPLLTASVSGGGPVNAQAAPPAVTQALGNNTAFIAQTGAAQSNLFRLEAAVPLSTGKILHLTQDAVLLRQGSNTVAPWRILRERAAIESDSTNADS
ncbi:MAG: general secretion pathway protein GspK [Burkholderiaceae bacterium]|jgi:general secretion pathway protein K|nr:general secretion pathway protein GspK [Burkholderiaceae bacterium]